MSLFTDSGHIGEDQGTADRARRWVILPLRLFLGLSFVFAGMDKLTDPAFLDPSARAYIGNQIRGFAPGTPLEGFLLGFAAPSATLFGIMVIGGELCIGVAVLLGALTRFSAAMGLLLNLTFFLSATWNVHPFYFGADLPYAVCWLTLLLCGPGPYAVDHLLKRWVASGHPAVEALARTSQTGWLRTSITRRAFLAGGAAAIAGAAIAASGVGWAMLRTGVAGSNARPGAPPSPQAQITQTAGSSAEAVGPSASPSATKVAAGDPNTPTSIPGPGSIPTSPANAGSRGALVTPAGTLPAGRALPFDLPNGDPALLVHDEEGYHAYVAICTHQGCEVAYKAVGSTGVLKCPCHGAEYDPGTGSVLLGPATAPLSQVPILVASDGSVYLGQ